MPTTTRAPRPHIPSGGAVGWRFPHGELLHLPNGIRLHCFDLPGRTLTAVRLLIRTPLPLEPSDGIGAVTAALWSKGGATSSAERFAGDLARLGATYEAEMSELGPQVALDVNGAALPEALTLLASSMLQPAFRAEDVARQIKLRAAEYELAQSRAETRAAEEIVRLTAPAGSRFSRPVAGTPDTTSGLTSAAVGSYHHDHVVASRADLVLAGAIDPSVVSGLVTRAFGLWRPGAPAAEATVARTAAASGTVIVDRPGVASEVTAPAVAETQRVLAEVVEHGFRSAERDAAVDFMLNSEPVRLQASAGVAEAASALVRRGRPIADFDRNRDILAETSAEQATAALRKIMPAGRPALAAVGDSARIAEPMEKVAHGPVRLVGS